MNIRDHITYAGAIGADEFVFVDDDARSHHADIVKEFFQEEGIDRMRVATQEPWPQP